MHYNVVRLYGNLIPTPTLRDAVLGCHCRCAWGPSTYGITRMTKFRFLFAWMYSHINYHQTNPTASQLGVIPVLPFQNIAKGSNLNQLCLFIKIDMYKTKFNDEARRNFFPATGT